MGNCFAICRPNKHQSKVVQVVKMDGKMLEFTAPIIVKDLLGNFSGFGVAVSETLSQHLPPTYELKIGKIYYLLPCNPTSTVETEPAQGIKRIKVVITKQQLQELLSKQQISVEDVLLGVERRRTCSSVDSLPTTCWKPKLEPIPEGSE